MGLFRALHAIVGISILPLLVLRMTYPNPFNAYQRAIKEHRFGGVDGSPIVIEERLETKPAGSDDNGKGGCAICLFGLPRSFQTLVLPSIINNVLIPNLEYGCDIFAHYYDIQYEEKGRASKGGVIDTESIAHLKEKVEEIYNKEEYSFVRPIPNIVVVSDTDETFWASRGEQITNYRHAKAEDGNFKYFPWKDKSYDWPASTDNIVKQWHSIQSVWDTMEVYGGVHRNQHYSRIAMLRSDVVYVTPIDVYETAKKKTIDRNNTIAVIPKFATYPVNDRMIYGPYGAVQVWATERFDRLEQHSLDRPGYGMHSERYLKESILPAIIENGFEVQESPHTCFFRARADGQVHLNDCDDNSRFSDVSFRRKQIWVEQASNATCVGFIGKNRVHQERVTHRRVNCE